MLQQSMLEYMEERGHDVMDTILGCVFRVGMEQGYRHARSFNNGQHRSLLEVDAAVDRARAKYGDDWAYALWIELKNSEHPFPSRAE